MHSIQISWGKDYLLQKELDKLYFYSTRNGTQGLMDARQEQVPPATELQEQVLYHRTSPQSIVFF
jgi:hypothetical protein